MYTADITNITKNKNDSFILAAARIHQPILVKVKYCKSVSYAMKCEWRRKEEDRPIEEKDVTIISLSNADFSQVPLTAGYHFAVLK